MVDIPTNGSFTVDGNNAINTSTSNIDSGFIQFSLATAPNITWWKGMKVNDNSGNQILLLETQDASHGPVTSQKFNRGSFGQTINIEIWKAKTFGVHTHIDSGSLSADQANGKLVSFVWQND